LNVSIIILSLMILDHSYFLIMQFKCVRSLYIFNKLSRSISNFYKNYSDLNQIEKLFVLLSKKDSNEYEKLLQL
jgi:hypothetical protein